MSTTTAAAWLDPGIVAGFVAAPPNSRLIDYARRLSRGSSLAVLDIGVIYEAGFRRGGA
jgi:hypothetical protein